MYYVFIAAGMAALFLWSKNREFKDLQADYAQATYTAWRLMMSATNSEELHDQMKQWTDSGAMLSAIGDEISTGNRRVMRVNQAILKNSKGQSWSQANKEFREQEEEWDKFKRSI